MTRKRKNEIRFRLNDQEYKELNDNVMITGLSRESYIRMILAGKTPHQMPTDELIEIINQIRKIGVNINQIAYQANVNGYIDREKYEKNFIYLQDEIDHVIECFYK